VGPAAVAEEAGLLRTGPMLMRWGHTGGEVSGLSGAVGRDGRNARCVGLAGRPGPGLWAALGYVSLLKS
jgi:hypothetical protein